jgi:DNA-binding LacI/PurR family transcriptional regulator
LDIAEQLIARIRHMPPGSRCPGIAEIAAEWRVARATAEKVLRHLADRGYVNRVVGSGTFVANRGGIRIAIMPYCLLSSKATRPSYTRDYYLQVAASLASQLHGMGREVEMIGNVDGMPDLVACQRWNPALCVVIGAKDELFLETLIRHGYEAIAVDSACQDLPVDFVRREYIRRGYRATRAFIEGGLSDIHYVGLQPNCVDRRVASSSRTAGFAEACWSAGLDPPERVHLAATARELSRLVRQLLWRDRPPQAIIAMDGLVGSFVKTCADRMGLRVPQDVSVLVESGLPYSRVTCLATMAEHMASAVADLVAHRLADPSQPPQVRLVASVLVDRGTVAPEVMRVLDNTVRLRGHALREA